MDTKKDFSEWLSKTTGNLSAPQARRVKLLAWLLLFILLLLIAAIILVLLVNPVITLNEIEYVLMIAGMAVVASLAFGLNRAGKYIPATWLTVTLAFLAPWGALVFDQSILKGDYFPLCFVLVSILLSSVLLSPRTTILLTVLQFVGIILVLVFNPATALINWPSLVSLIFFISVLSILINFITRSDVRQIEYQSYQLEVSEALLRELSIRDPLTNLFNRRYLDERLKLELQRAARKNAHIGVIMVDIDHFKDLNDSLGHAAGDKVLQEISKLFTLNIRSFDIPCRYGGEEFILILLDASLEGTVIRANELREKVSRLTIPLEKEIIGNITISLGVATSPEHGDTCEALLKSADTALYHAKNGGRNRVATANEN